MVSEPPSPEVQPGAAPSQGSVDRQAALYPKCHCGRGWFLESSRPSWKENQNPQNYY